MDDSKLSIEKTGNCRRSERIRIARGLNCKPTSQKEASKRMKRTDESKISTEGSRSRRRSLRSSVRRDLNCMPKRMKRIPGARETSLDMESEKSKKGKQKQKPISNVGRIRSQCDRRTLIWSGGHQPSLVTSSGITWVAVRGADSICVVAKIQDVDKARFHPSYWIDADQTKLRCFMKTIIVEMEDPSSELLQSFEQGAEMRSFAAVSVALLPDEVPKESDHEAYQMRPAELEAINFLKVKMKDDPAFYRGGRYTRKQSLKGLRDLCCVIYPSS